VSSIAYIQIHQAYFGAVNGTSHGQLASSLTDNNLRSFLAAFTDRPGVLPSGFELKPYLAATTYESYYLICRTWPDNEVLRLGMVFTHVLILPLQGLPEILDLSSVLSLLLENPLSVEERPTSLSPLALPILDEQTNPLLNVVPESWLAIINQLVEQETTTVFAIGDINRFVELIEALWRGLPGSLRAQLSWGVRFTPPGAKDHVPVLINVPDELKDKWRGKPTINLATDVANTPVTPIEQLILSREQGQDFINFIERLDVSVQSFRGLKLCQRAYEQFTSLQPESIETGKLLALLRTLRQLQPEADKAVVVKQTVVQALATALPINGIREAMGLRNLPLTPFLPNGNKLKQAVEQVVYTVVTTATPDETIQKSLLTYLAQTNPESIEIWWNDAAVTAFEYALQSNTLHVARMVWLGISQGEPIRNYVLGVVPKAPDWEFSLSKTIPVSLPVAVADSILNFSASRHWWDLLAVTAKAAYKPVEALRKQINAERHLGIRVSSRVSMLSKQVSDRELVALAVELSNTQLQELAGDICGRNPSLLLPIDVRQQSWRTIWSRSVLLTKSVIAGLSNPAETINAFLIEVANKRASETQLLEAIADSAYANILRLPERTKLWHQLSPELLPEFVSATLNALVEEIIVDKWTDDIDSILLTKARSLEFISRFLGGRRNDPAAVLTANAQLHNLTDSYLKDYINNLATINAITAVQLGKLVHQNRWKSCANVLLSKSKTNPAFRPALYECAGMFDRLTKFFNYQLFGQTITPHDAWNVLEELMANLYEEGPDQDNIWKRAGGDISKLKNSQSRSEQWAAAITLLRYGGGGKHISPKSLLSAALDDYASNSNVQTLAKLSYLFTS
jgi:hypothetical protein